MTTVASAIQPPACHLPPPSRRDNPFATCWTRPGALAFRYPTGTSAPQLIAQLADLNWRAAIIGPHGSGKSTLLHELKPELANTNRDVRDIALHDGQRKLPPHFYNDWIPGRTVVIVDGYEQLGWLERLRLARRTRKANVGLVITAHATTSLPTLIQLAPNEQLVAELVAQLCAEVSTPVTIKDVAASHACHGSNVREIFFDLYDRHERTPKSSVVS